MENNSVINVDASSCKIVTDSDKLHEVLSTPMSFGFWTCAITPKGRRKLYANEHMLNLLGVSGDTEMSPEDLYDYWYNRIDPAYHTEVEGYINAMIENEESDIEYFWKHPTIGRITVHCGGRKCGESGDSRYYHGYYRNITSVLHFQKHYRKTTAEMTLDDSMLSFISRKMYSLVITVNIKSNEFTFIEGTGMEQCATDLRAAKTYRECYNNFYTHALPEYRKQLCNLISLDYLLNLDLDEGLAGTIEYLSSVNNKVYWREMSVYMGYDLSGNRIANILVRDIDKIRREQVAKQREFNAVNAKMRVLAEITKKMYGFNVTVDLNTGNFSAIHGSGLENVTPFMSGTNDYPTMLERMLEIVDDEYVKSLRALLGFDFLVASEISDSAIGTETFSVHVYGKRYWHEITVFRMTDESGNPTANIISRDVTAIKEAEELRKNEERKQRFNDIVMSEITRSLYGYNISVNLNTQRYTLIEGNGTDVAVDILKKHEFFQDAIDAKLKVIDPTYAKELLDLVSIKKLRTIAESGHTGFLKTMTYKSAIGAKPAWHEISVFIGTNAEGEPIANLLGRDVTDIKRKQDEQLESERAANAARSYFFSTVSHDIRTPLNAIIGYAELLKSGIEDKAEREQALESVAVSGKALMHLINDVLDLSKLESGNMEIVYEPTDTFSVINETLSAFSLVCSKKNIELVRDIHEMPRLMLDAYRIRQLLFNLIGNAVKFTSKGSVTVSATYIDRELVISIKDTGVGIKKSEQARIMTPYVQVDGSGRHGGTGLGLAISNQLAQRMGGELSVKSEFGKGSVFTITIPHVLVAEDNHEKIEQEAKTDAQGASVAVNDELPQNILIVDDSVVNLKVLAAMLRKLGIKKIHQADSAKKALEMLREITVDVILTDLWMPGMSGTEFAETLRMTERAAGRDPSPICAVTADVESVTNDSNSKFDGMLLKPVVIKDLLKLLKKVKIMRGGRAEIVKL